MKLHALSLHGPCLILVLALAGCVTPQAGEFPSLAKRPQETVGDNTENSTAYAIAAPADAALLAQLRDLNARVATGEAAFVKNLPQARSAMAAARGAAPASEPWAQAAMLLAALDLDRGSAQTALAELDQLMVDHGTAVTGSSASIGRTEIDAAWARANDIVTAQTRIVETLKLQLPPA